MCVVWATICVPFTVTWENGMKLYVTKSVDIHSLVVESEGVVSNKSKGTYNENE